MKIKAYITLMLATLLMTACSHIDEDEQLIYVKPAPVERSVLLEDFTGQRCVNCPLAADEIAKLHEQYGEDAIIAVSIHSGPLGFHTNPRFLGLATDVGDEYYNHWNLEFQIRQELQKTAPVNIDLMVNPSDDNQIDIYTEIQGVDGNTQGKLQLWIVEDDITAFQMMPDGTRNDNYIHQHVFRAAVNGEWGEDVEVLEGYSISNNHIITISDEWNLEKLSVIAFVYNDSGVLQVTKAKLQNDEPLEE